MAFSDWTQLQPEWSRLKGFYGEVRAAASIATVPDEAWSGINNRLTIAANGIARLGSDGDLGKGLIAGTLSIERWAAVANSIGNALTSVLHDFKAEDLYGRFWEEVIIPTAVEVRDTAAAAGRAAPWAAGGILIALALLVALKVLK